MSVFIPLKRMMVWLSKKLYKTDYDVIRHRLQIEAKKVNIDDLLKLPLKKILISGEDHRFNYHYGFDIIGICRALKNRIFFNRIEGASTIEQQLVRVLINDYRKTLKRKIKEVFLSTTLTEFVPRSDIPFIYLNIAYYGTDMVGFEEAFNSIKIKRPIEDVESICAELVARIKYPEPKDKNVARLGQIEERKHHLIMLYQKHSLKKRFKIYD